MIELDLKINPSHRFSTNIIIRETTNAQIKNVFRPIIKEFSWLPISNWDLKIRDELVYSSPKGEKYREIYFWIRVWEPVVVRENDITFEQKIWGMHIRINHEVFFLPRTDSVIMINDYFKKAQETLRELLMKIKITWAKKKVVPFYYKKTLLATQSNQIKINIIGGNP